MRSMRVGVGLMLALSTTIGAQAAERPAATGWEFLGLPILNFSTDEGVGYGAFAQIYNYGAGALPYLYTIQPTVMLTTKGRRDLVLFFDAPTLLPRGWRLDVILAREEQLANPYYGVGNATVYDSTLEQPPNPYYYRYGSVNLRTAANLQHRIGDLPARFLVGLGFGHVTTDPTPFDSGTTLLATELGASPAPEGNVNFVRAGVVWDTRDREIAPTRGTLADVIVQRVDKVLGATTSYTRATATVRHFIPATSRVVIATRFLAQQTSGDLRLYDRSTILASYKQAEGVGGSNSVRGWARNRFVGKSLVVGNAEVRWRFIDFNAAGKSMHLVASGFLDAGRVWDGGLVPGEIFSDLHSAVGGGLRIGVGQSFVIAVDYGKSTESGQLYIGLGYPF